MNPNELLVSPTQLDAWNSFPPPIDSLNYTKLQAMQLAIDLVKSGRLEEEGIIPAAEAIYEFIKN